MTQTELSDAICEALNNLHNWDVNCFHYWMEELYDGDNEIWNNWTVDNLARIEKDVMYAFSDAVDDVTSELIGK